MDPFTPVANWLKGGQDGDAANELIKTYFEKRLVVGDPASGFGLLENGINAQRVYNNPSWGGDGQGKNVFQEIQEWMELRCTSFLDTTTPTSFLNVDKQEFVYFTKATWQAAAGLYVSGTPGVDCLSYRRKAQLEDAWSYGTFLPGELRGPWCFEDIQNGLKALKYTKVDWGPECLGKTLSWKCYPYDPVFHPHNPTVAEYEALFDAAWLTTAWGARDWRYGVSAGEGLHQPFGEWELTMNAARYKARQTLSFVNVPRIVEVWMYPNEAANYCDYDGISLTPGEYGLFRTEPESATSPVVFDWIGDVEECPRATYPNGIGENEDKSGYFQTGCFVLSEKPVVNVIKWRWSYGED